MQLQLDGNRILLRTVKQYVMHTALQAVMNIYTYILKEESGIKGNT